MTQKNRGIVRREVEVDHLAQVEKLKQQFEAESTGSKLRTQQDQQKKVERIIEIATDAAAQATKQLIQPLLPLALKALVILPEDERNSAIASLPEHLRDPIQRGIKTIERQIPELLAVLKAQK